MITVDYKNDILKNAIRLEIKGHADYQNQNDELICAAVSAIITGGFNYLSIISIKESKFKIEDGYALAIVPITSFAIVNAFLLMYTQLSTIAEKHKNFLKTKKTITLNWFNILDFQN